MEREFWKGSTLQRSSHSIFHTFSPWSTSLLEAAGSALCGGCLVNFLPTTFLRHDSSSTHEIKHGRRRRRRRSFLPRAPARAPLRQDAACSLRRRIQPRKGRRLRLLRRPPVEVPPLGLPAGRCDDADPAANGAPRGGSEGELRLLPWR